MTVDTAEVPSAANSGGENPTPAASSSTPETAEKPGVDARSSAPENPKKEGTPRADIGDVKDIFDQIAHHIAEEHRSAGRPLTWAELEGRGIREKVIDALS